LQTLHGLKFADLSLSAAYSPMDLMGLSLY